MTSRPSARVRFLAAAAGVALLGAGCTSTKDTGGGETLDRAKDDKEVKVGFAAEQPYGFKKGGKLVGEAPDLHTEIFDRIGGIAIDGQQIDFNSLIQKLNAGDIDVVSAGMFITHDRCQEAAFSNPEYVAKTALMVPKGNPDDLTDLESAADEDVKLAVMRGAVEKGYAEAAGVDDFEVVADQQSGIDAVTSGRADAFALTDISLNWAAKGRDDVEVTESFTPEVDGKPQIGAGGAVFRPEDTELREAFNKELKAVLADGDAWLDIVGKYGFTEDNKPDPDMTAEEFCKG